MTDEFEALLPACLDDELWSLCSTMCDGTSDEDRLARLESLLEADAANRLFCACYMRMNGQLMRTFRPVASPAVDDGSAPAIQSSRVTFLGNALSSTVGYFSSGWPVAYLIATVMLGIGLLVGYVTYVSQSVQVAHKSVPRPSPPSSLPSFVGRITGMVDCQWADPETEAFNGACVPLGRRYALSTGLMEITYDTGAKVILQGPCVYQADSAAGGFLSLGKLTARVEKKVDSRESRVESTNRQSPDPKSQIPNLLLSTLNSQLFAIRTPTAMVTDLGTEFGVEVGEQGQTTSHVFRGSVKVQPVGSGESASERDVIMLHENESVRTETSGMTDDRTIAIRRTNADPTAFVRQMIRAPKCIDLLDIVAGGNGAGHRRERGIDPASGMEDPVFVAAEHDADSRYRSITWSKMIDGVFVPNGEGGPVVLDSAGHAFDGFRKTDGKAYGSIWARAANVRPNDRDEQGHRWVYYTGKWDQYMPSNRGLLGLHANAGITFNLAAMRDKYPGVQLVRFHAVAGVAEAPKRISPDEGTADIYVFVDGQLKLDRMQFRPSANTLDIDVEIGPNDRFLTLAATDGGQGCSCNWVVFGDARIDVEPNSDDSVH